MSVADLITDRTSSDVTYAKQIFEKIKNNTATKEETALFMGGLKGAYNAVDLNRVESAVAYITELLLRLPEELRAHAEEYGVSMAKIFNVPYDAKDLTIESKTDWSVSDFFDYPNQKRYINNVQLLSKTLNDEERPLPKNFSKFNYKSANEIERLLVDLDKNIKEARADKKKKIENTASAWFFSGDLYGGEA
jgi:hypothetical protein